MKKLVITTVTYATEIEIPDNKIPEILKNFRESITSRAIEDDLFEQAAFGFEILDQDEFIEGLGDLKEEGIKIKHIDRNIGYEVENL